MTTATHYDALDLFDQVINNVLRPRTYDNTCKPQAKAAPQEVRFIRLDVAETEDAYLVSAELPGVRKEDISITFEGKQLVLNAQVANAIPVAAVTNAEAGTDATPAVAPKRQLLAERFLGKMTRRLQLPQDIDQDGVQAKFTDGVLELVLPKQKPKAGRRIEIQ